jgi:hypothetical protein
VPLKKRGRRGKKVQRMMKKVAKMERKEGERRKRMMSKPMEKTRLIIPRKRNDENQNKMRLKRKMEKRMNWRKR